MNLGESFSSQVVLELAHLAWAASSIIIFSPLKMLNHTFDLQLKASFTYTWWAPHHNSIFSLTNQNYQNAMARNALTICLKVNVLPLSANTRYCSAADLNLTNTARAV